MGTDRAGQGWQLCPRGVPGCSWLDLLPGIPGSADPSGVGGWGWLCAQPAPSGTGNALGAAPGLGQDLLDECSVLSGLNFSCFLLMFSLFGPSWVCPPGSIRALHPPLSFQGSVTFPAGRVFLPCWALQPPLDPALALGKLLPYWEDHQGEAAGITGEPRLSHLAQHIQGICRGCSSHPWKRHKDLNLLFWRVQGAP